MMEAIYAKLSSNKKLTFGEIVEFLRNSRYSLSEIASGEDEEGGEIDFQDLGLGAVEVGVHREGGPDRGSHWEMVHHFVDHGIYIKFTGWYSSYEGVYIEWDGDDAVAEVRPRPKTITVYE